MIICRITDPPREDTIEWPTGMSRWPVFGNPFMLECPLVSNPPATYTWRKYRTLDREEEIDFSDDVMFSRQGKSWQVGSYSKNDSGVYTCTASNQLGTEVYSDDTLFFLQPNC